MSYKQKVTYQGNKILSNKVSTRATRPSNVDSDINKLNEVTNASPVGPAKDTYGYIGFTSQES